MVTGLVPTLLLLDVALMVIDPAVTAFNFPTPGLFTNAILVLLLPHTTLCPDKVWPLTSLTVAE